MDNTKTINILSLCTGYGGLELGLAGALEGVFRVVAVEVEAYALANLATKAQEGRLAIEAMWPDVKTFPAERFRGCFDFVLAGYPCQPFSVAGKRQGTDDPRHLWPHIARIVQAVRPVWCFFENVPGHLTLGFPEVYRSLRDMGYSVEAGIFSAAEVGAPHKRERLFILAHAGYSTGCTEYRQQQKECTEELCRSSQLAHCQSNRYGRGAISCNTDENRIQKSKRIRPKTQGSRCRSQLGDTGTTEFQGRQGQQRNDGAKFKAVTGSCDKWPSRPGQPQYEWEEPRVVEGNVDDSKLRNEGAVKLDVGQSKRKINKHRGADTSRNKAEGQAQ